MVGGSRGERDLPTFDHWQEEGVGERQVKDHGAGLSYHGEPSILTARVEEGATSLCYFLKVAYRGTNLPW